LLQELGSGSWQKIPEMQGKEVAPTPTR